MEKAITVLPSAVPDSTFGPRRGAVPGAAAWSCVESRTVSSAMDGVGFARVATVRRPVAALRVAIRRAALFTESFTGCGLLDAVVELGTAPAAGGRGGGQGRAALSEGGPPAGCARGAGASRYQ
ncbi:hypothetical protein GCM10010272_65910 [Streptomyces lateritius]|nr:hypothetical protein GCM10010272_65910 [Streptomyces lateritius]